MDLKPRQGSLLVSDLPMLTPPLSLIHTDSCEFHPLLNQPISQPSSLHCNKLETKYLYVQIVWNFKFSIGGPTGKILAFLKNNCFGVWGRALPSLLNNQSLTILFLAALSSSRRLVVGWLVRWLVRWSEDLCEKVTFRVLNCNLNLPTYLPMRH